MSASRIRILLMRIVMSVFFAVLFSRFFPSWQGKVLPIAAMAFALLGFAYILEYAGHKGSDA